MNTPILLLTYNRPDFVFDRLQFIKENAAKSPIFLSCDGYKNNPKSKKINNEIRKIVADFSTSLNISTQFLKKNYGCRIGVEKGLDWFFSKVDSGIIIEDDCAPTTSFLSFAEELLEKYKNDERISLISGTNPIPSTPCTDSYFFSRQSIIWGWATWKRSWEKYRFYSKNYENILSDQNLIKTISKYSSEKHLKTMKMVLEGKIDTWDYIWYFTNIVENKISCIPKNNLVSNLGFDERATHTKLVTSQASMPTIKLNKPFKHPKHFTPNSYFEVHYTQLTNPFRLLLDVFKTTLLRLFLK